MMNSVPAGVSGTITEVVADNAELVEYGRAAVPGGARVKRISRVFVANRGEIALRIVNACEELGLETVVGASEVDRERPRRAPGRPRGVHRAGAGRAELSARRRGRAGGARHRLRRHPSRLRVPVREPQAGRPRARERSRLRRAAGRGDRAERRQAAAPARRRPGPASRSCPARRSKSAVQATARRPSESATRCWSRRPGGGAAAGSSSPATPTSSTDCSAWPAARRAPRSATSAFTSSGSSPPPATSRCRSPPTSTARSCTWASATARCSAATRR